VKNRKKLIIFAILIFLLSASASGAYAYWAGTVNAPAEESDTISINIGEAKPIDVMLSFTKDSSSLKLVPAGQKNNSLDSANCVEEFVVNYEFTLIPDPAMSVNPNDIAAELKFEVGQITLGGVTTYASLVNITAEYWHEPVDEYPGEWKALYPLPSGNVWLYNGYNRKVKVKVTLTEPATKAIYDEVFGKEISIPLTFKAILPLPPLP